MFDFLKTFITGILAVLLLPFLCLFLVGYAIYGLGLFIFILVKTIIIDLKNMFNKKGEFINPFKELPEDVQCRQILERQKQELQNPQEKEVQPQSVNNIVYQQNFYGYPPPNPQQPFSQNPYQQQLPYGQNPGYFNDPNNQIPNPQFPPIANNPFGALPNQPMNPNPYQQGMPNPYQQGAPVQYQQIGHNVVNPAKPENLMTDDLEDDKGGQD